MHDLDTSAIYGKYRSDFFGKPRNIKLHWGNLYHHLITEAAFFKIILPRLISPRDVTGNKNFIGYWPLSFRPFLLFKKEKVSE